MERNTRQRTAIREAISHAARPLLPHEVLEAAQVDVPGISIATVYRNLRVMVEEGELKTVMLPNETARFELEGAGHHHHFQCLQCQRVFEVDACPGDFAALAPAGFTVEDHELTLYGRCGDCAPKGEAKSRKAANGKARRAHGSTAHPHR
jgi:Fur family ferric uptake transcriptional regulator